MTLSLNFKAQEFGRKSNTRTNRHKLTLTRHSTLWKQADKHQKPHIKCFNQK